MGFKKVKCPKCNTVDKIVKNAKSSICPNCNIRVFYDEQIEIMLTKEKEFQRTRSQTKEATQITYQK